MIATAPLITGARTSEFLFNLGESFSALDKGFDGFIDEAGIFLLPRAFAMEDVDYVAPPCAQVESPSGFP